MRKLAKDIILQATRLIIAASDEELAVDYNGKDIQILRKCADRIEEARKNYHTRGGQDGE